MALLDNIHAKFEPITLKEVAQAPKESNCPPESLVIKSDILTLKQEAVHVSFVERLTSSDEFTQRSQQHLGVLHGNRGSNVPVTDRIADNVIAIMQQLQELLFANGLDEKRNQCSIADYPPSVGVKICC